MQNIQNRIILFLLGTCIGFVITMTMLTFTNKPDMVAVFSQKKDRLMYFWDPYDHVEIGKTNAVSLKEKAAFESHHHVKELGK